MFIRKRTSPPVPTAPPGPDRDGEVRVFRSQEHLVAWLSSLDSRPQALRAISPRHQGDLSRTLALVAEAPNGGAVLITPGGAAVRGWLDEVAQEHAPEAIGGPWPVRVGDSAGLLISVSPSEAPTTWNDWEPDAWPVPKAEASAFDARRLQAFKRSRPFARPTDQDEAEHESDLLLSCGALRWFRGRLVPTIAGLVAFGDATDRFLPGCAVVIRWPEGHDELYQGSLSWVVRRVCEQRRLWGPVPPEVARIVITLALADRAWAGPDAATPITISVEAGGLRIAIPTRAANPVEEEIRAPGNPRLRGLLVHAGLLPAVQGLDALDNDEVLATLDAVWPGVRNRYEDDVTWIEVPFQARASFRRVPSGPVVSRRAAPGEPTPAKRPVAVVSAAPPAPPAAGPARLREPSVQVQVQSVGSATPAAVTFQPPLAPPQPERPAPRRAPPVFHPRPPAAPAPAQTPAHPLQEQSPLEPPPSPSLADIPPPPASAAGPRTLDERKAQLRAILLQSDRPLAARELAEALAVHRDTLTPALKALVGEGWLAPTDPNPRSPVQRYRRVGG